MYYANGGRVAQFDSPEALFPSALHFSGEGELFPIHIFYEDDDDGETFAKGGLARSALSVKRAGRHGDTEIVHINKEELEELKQMWGEPTINPETGQPEFFLKKVWRGIKKVVRPIAKILPIATSFLGLSPLASAAIGALSGGVSGGLKGALLGGALGGFGGNISKGIQGGLKIANPALSRAVSGALMGGATSGVTGGNILKGMLTGGALGAAIGPGGIFNPNPSTVIPTQTSTAGGPYDMSASNINPADVTIQTPALNPITTSPTTSEIVVRAPGMGGPYTPVSTSNAPTANVTPATQKPNFWNQKPLEKLGIGIQNKYLVPGALGLALLADKMRKPATNFDTMDARNKFFGKDFFDGTGGGGFRLASLGPPNEDYERDYLSGYAGGGDVHHGGGHESFAVRGPGDGRSDDIPAMLSDGEYVIDAETVALLGDGSNKAGAKKLDDLRVQIRKHKGKSLSKGKISRDAKPAMRYMAGGRI